MNKRFDVRKLAIIGILGGISTILGLTPLGFIPIGPTRATIMHIPVIIGAIMEGPLVGAFVGLIFGLFSIFQAVTNPTPVSFVFLNPLVSVLPRVLIGLFSFYSYDFLRRIGDKKTRGLLYLIWIGIITYLIYGIYQNIINKGSIWYIIINIGLMVLTIALFYFTMIKYKKGSFDLIISSVVGTLTNTLGVLTMIYILFGERFVEALGQDPSLAKKIIYGIGITNGIPEAIIAIIIVTAVVRGLKGTKRD
ncbi:ECF transporter S component [Tissierella creatinini]|nr:ECF transporter S component [Tissierella creatinini]TJX63727.1 ECF transporter S component [Soehngenia saccharolytica]